MTVGRETLRRLVHDQDLRVRNQRPADREHLLLATRELCTAVSLALAESRKEVVDALTRPLAAPVGRRSSRRDAQVLVDGERREEATALRDVTDTTTCDLVRLTADELVPLETDRAARAWR